VTEPSAGAHRAGGLFPTTRWTLILASRQGADARRAGLEALFAGYWRPIYIYLRRKGLPSERAEDVVQGFFASLLEREFLERADPARGRFRSFLRTSVDHYLANLYEKEAAQKRGGGLRFVSLDVALAERDLPADPESPDLAFDREWAVAVMERSLGRLRNEYEQGKRRGRIETVLRFFGFGEPPSYAEAAAESGMNLPQFKASLHRARARFREILIEEVGATVASDGEAAGELLELRRLLA
jgi:RNA polymerase sigma-70 factor (ECF subfamily)